MTPELLSKRPIQRVIRKTADYFSGAISERVPPEMADALRKDLYIFSGFRTYHELKESAERLLRPDGSLKPFSEFYSDTLKVRDKYNKAWLKAEYNYAVRTADAAARWAEIEKDKEHIDLLYETVGDSNVRPDHAALEGVCLPVDDPFWAIAYPPNGWNCRCRVLRVAKGSHPYSNSDEATEAFIESTSGKSELFRYNPGKEQRIFSDRHPYYSKRGIRHCAISGDKLAANLDKNEECEVLKRLLPTRKLSLDKEIREIIEKEGKSEHAATRKAYKDALKKDFYPEKIRKELRLQNGEKKMIPIVFRGYGIDHMIDDLIGKRCKGVSLDELFHLEEHINKAQQIKRDGKIYKKRKDNISYFYYLETEISGVGVEIHLAGQVVNDRFLIYPYCIKKKKAIK